MSSFSCFSLVFLICIENSQASRQVVYWGSECREQECEIRERETRRECQYRDALWIDLHCRQLGLCSIGTFWRAGISKLSTKRVKDESIYPLAFIVPWSKVAPGRAVFHTSRCACMCLVDFWINWHHRSPGTGRKR